MLRVERNRAGELYGFLCAGRTFGRVFRQRRGHEHCSSNVLIAVLSARCFDAGCPSAEAASRKSILASVFWFTAITSLLPESASSFST